MPRVESEIPAALQPDVDAAIAWFNTTEPETFEVTGIVDPDASLGSASPRELRLVLCGGDRCEQRTFLVRETPAGRDVGFAEDRDATETGAPVAELDPPPGALRGWLDRTLQRHAFTVLVFYRGYW